MNALTPARKREILQTLSEAAGRSQEAGIAALRSFDTDEVVEAIMSQRAPPLRSPKSNPPKAAPRRAEPPQAQPLQPKPLREIVSPEDICAASGVRSEAGGFGLVWDAVSVRIARGNGSTEQEAAGAIEWLKALNPQDGVDGVLGALMLACSSMAMESLMFAKVVGVSPNVAQQRAMYLAQAGQLARTTAQLAETLDRRRNGGSQSNSVTQRIVVERITSGGGGRKRSHDG
jgi:hypothetical protein